jgi:hypothetical protein
MINTFFNPPSFEKGVVFSFSILVVIFLSWQIKSYLNKVDSEYFTLLSAVANQNRLEADKAGHVALHELSFSWLKGVKMTLKTLPKQQSTGTR